jgi:hypothetical protein
MYMPTSKTCTHIYIHKKTDLYTPSGKTDLIIVRFYFIENKHTHTHTHTNKHTHTKKALFTINFANQHIFSFFFVFRVLPSTQTQYQVWQQ